MPDKTRRRPKYRLRRAYKKMLYLTGGYRIIDPGVIDTFPRSFDPYYGISVNNLSKHFRVDLSMSSKMFSEKQRSRSLTPCPFSSRESAIYSRPKGGTGGDWYLLGFTRSTFIYPFIPAVKILSLIFLILSLILAASSNSSFFAASFISVSSLFRVSSSYPYTAISSAATGTVQ